MRRVAAPVFLGLWLSCIGCGAPGAPAWSSDSFAPPRAAAETCLPPYPTFEPGRYWLSDLERNTVCALDLERDECIASILHDCTAESTTDRSWVGRGSASDTITFSLIYPSNEAAEAQDPRCCRGRLDDWRDREAYSTLECSTSTCDTETSAAPDHLGFYLEKKTPAPFVTKAAHVLLGDAPARQLLALTTRDGRDIAVVRTAPGAGAGNGNGSDAGPAQVVAFLPDDALDGERANHVLIAEAKGEGQGEAESLKMAADPDRRVLVVATGNQLSRIDTDNTELLDLHAQGSVALEGVVEAMAVSRTLVVVATATAAPDGSSSSVKRTLSARRLFSLSDVIFSVPLSGDGLDQLVSVASSTLIAVGIQAFDRDEATILGIHNDGQVEALMVGTDIDNIRAIDDSKVAYTDRCAKDVPSRTCYFELALTDPRAVRRLIVPDVGAIQSIELISESSLVAVLSGSVVAVLDRSRWRPWLSGYATTEREVDILSASATHVFTASSTSNAIDIMTVTPMSR